MEVEAIAEFAAGLAPGALVFALIELAGMHLLSPFFVSFGLRAHSETLDLPIPSESLIRGGVVTREDGKFRFTDRDECFFVPLFRLLDFAKAQTPMPYKCHVVWSEGGATVTARVPLGTTLLLALALVGWTAGGYGAGALYVLAGWAFVGGIAVASVSLERKRLRRMLDELRELLEAGSTRHK